MFTCNEVTPGAPQPEPETTTKRCTKCGEVKALTEFGASNRGKDGRHRHCKICARAIQREYNRTHPSRLQVQRARMMEKSCEYKLVSAAKQRAKARGLPFDISERDIHIPEKCPALGIPLKRGTGLNSCLPTSPSLDQITPGVGYVKGNVRVISHKANRIKSNATLVESLQVALYMARCAEEKATLGLPGTSYVASVGHEQSGRRTNP